tara:strand:- start:1016 stop:3124 length:2109 start_codon:yes stop_codon:yes gene_type:complete
MEKGFFSYPSEFSINLPFTKKRLDLGIPYSDQEKINQFLGLGLFTPYETADQALRRKQKEVEDFNRNQFFQEIEQKQKQGEAYGGRTPFFQKPFLAAPGDPKGREAGIFGDYFGRLSPEGIPEVMELKSLEEQKKDVLQRVDPNVLTSKPNLKEGIDEVSSLQEQINKAKILASDPITTKTGKKSYVDALFPTKFEKARSKVPNLQEQIDLAREAVEKNLQIQENIETDPIAKRTGQSTFPEPKLKKDIQQPQPEFDGQPSPGDEELLGKQQEIQKEALLEKSLNELMGEIPDNLSEEEKTKRMEQYKQDFYSATGINPSGKPDMRDAIVAFGLALLQNKAGKKLDIGKIFGAIGEAGQKALPLVQKAKKEARDIELKAAQYALGRSEEDRKKLGEKQDVLLVRRSPDGLADTLSNITSSRLENLSNEQINNLNNSKEFKDNFIILPFNEELIEQIIKSPEVEENYLTKSRQELLYPGAEGPDATMNVFDPDPNKAIASSKQGKELKPFILPSEYKRHYDFLKRKNEFHDKTKDKLEFIFNLDDSTVTIPGQIANSVVEIGRKFGVNLNNISGADAEDPDNPTPIEKANYILKVLQAQNAPGILQEAGRTISDGDRDRVAIIIGQIDFSITPQMLKEKMKSIYDILVVEGYQNIETGLKKINRNTGRDDLYVQDANDFSIIQSTEQGNKLLNLGSDGIFRLV